MKKGILKKVSLILILVACFIFYYKSYDKNKGLRALEWNENYYNDNNIQLYYEPIKNNVVDKRLIELKKIYKLEALISEEKSEIEKIMKLIEIANTIVSYDGVPSSLYSNGYDILKEMGERKKVSERDMAIITRDLILAYGYEARVGEFRKKKPQFQKNPNYYVVEYWSANLNKWIMVDFKNKGYIKGDDSELSAMDLIANQYKNIEFIGNISNKEFKKNIKPYLESYTIAIDNTLNMKKSNSYITFVNSLEGVDMKIYDRKFIEPTIYTEKVDLFQFSPWYKVDEKDEKGYIILKKKNENVTNLSDDEKIASLNTFIIGGFKDSSIMKTYFLSINNGEYEKIESYKEYEFIKGKNNIKLSLDGKSVSSEIVVVRDK